MSTGNSPVEHQNTDDAPPFFSMENLRIAQVPAVGGTLNGFTIGFVGVYAQMYLDSTDCSKYTLPDACDAVANADCEWDSGRNACGWKGYTCEWNHANNESACLDDDRCDWLYGDDVCKNPTGYTAGESGIFAGAMIVGAMIGSLFAGQFASKFGFKVSFWVIGVVGVISSVLCHVAAGIDQFWVLCIGRLVIGVVIGLVCVACPMYVDQNAHPKLSKVDGVLWQVFTTFGIMLAATLGLALGQSINYEKNAHSVARMEGFCAFSTLLCVLMIILGFAASESKTTFDGATVDKKDGAAALDPNEYSYMQMIGPLTMGVVMAGTLQLTGINAVMNYAPTIMGSLGMQPLVGNFVVMMWNFVTTLVSIPLARILSMRHLFLAASLVAASSCLLLCGIPVYPGVASENVKNGVAIFGIAVFIAAFEFGVGPCFFVLAQDLFPRSFRPKGSSFTIVANFVFNIIINVCYPIATEAISGGPSGDQDKGQSVAFIFFGCIGLVCFVLQVLFLFPWDESDGAQDDAHSVPADEHSPVEVATPCGNQQIA